MNEIQRELWKHCFQCGGEADYKVAGDAWCWKCDAAAHYAMGLQSVHDEVAKAWTPEWLIKEYMRLKEIEEAVEGLAGCEYHRETRFISEVGCPDCMHEHLLECMAQNQVS